MTESANIAGGTGPIRRLYAWFTARANGPHAWWILAVIAFAEASFFPIPPDVMVLPMMLANRKRAFAIAGWCTLWSVAGGMLGYAIGALFWKTLGLWLIGVLHIPLSEVEPAKDIVRRLRWKGPVFLVSGATGAGTDALKQAVMRYLEEHPRPQPKPVSRE